MKVHNIRINETEKKLSKLKNEFRDLYYNNTEIKDTVGIINLKENANITKITQQKDRPIPILLQDHDKN